MVSHFMIIELIQEKYFYLFGKIICKWTHGLVTVSNLNKKKVVDLGIAPIEKLKNIYSGIDLTLFINEKNDQFEKN